MAASKCKVLEPKGEERVVSSIWDVELEQGKEDILSYRRGTRHED